MLLTYSSRDLTKKSLRIDLFDFLLFVKQIKLCYNKTNKLNIFYSIRRYYLFIEKFYQKGKTMNKIHNNLTIDNLTKTDWINQFDKHQQQIIREGLR